MIELNFYQVVGLYFVFGLAFSLVTLHIDRDYNGNVIKEADDFVGMLVLIVVWPLGLVALAVEYGKDVANYKIWDKK